MKVNINNIEYYFVYIVGSANFGNNCATLSKHVARCSISHVARTCDYDQCHMITFRPISVAARNWSYDSSCCSLRVKTVIHMAHWWQEYWDIWQAAQQWLDRHQRMPSITGTEEDNHVLQSQIPTCIGKQWDLLVIPVTMPHILNQKKTHTEDVY